MSASLVGSEMCIRDRSCTPAQRMECPALACSNSPHPCLASGSNNWWMAVSYTHLTLPTICSV
eukprot:3464100-Alexandrium_andersonii.AAC.1